MPGDEEDGIVVDEGGGTGPAEGVGTGGGEEEVPGVVVARHF